MNVQATSIINALFNPEEIVNLRVFADKKDDTFKGLKLHIEAAKFQTIEEELIKHNEAGRGIFYVVNYGGDTDAEIKRINAVFMECDTLSFDEQMKLIDDFPLKPSMIIKTKKSLHTYWFVKDIEVKEFRPIQKALIKHFNSDPACVNESRVLRLPSFYHMKQEPVMVECILFHPEFKYTKEQFVKVLPIEFDETPVETKKGSSKGLDIVRHECEFIKYCETNAKTLSEHDWYAMISNLAPFDMGVELIHHLSEPYPNYKYNNTQKKINHFLESGTKPITCKTICEKGYKCSRYGTCTCKAPAGLAYRPMTAEGLSSVIDEIQITNDVFKDINACTNFIKNYLYNQDISLAETIVNHTLKEKFKFKQTEIKPLLTLLRDTVKKYQSSSEARNNESNNLPTWYSITKTGYKFMPFILAKHLEKEVNVFYAAEQHYFYENGVYRSIDELEVQKMVQDKLLDTEAKMNHITDTEHQWRMRVRKDMRELNSNPFLINVKNGLYNVLEDKLEEHTPDCISTVQLNVNYDKTAACPLFKKFLNDAMEGDTEQVNLIQEILGYLLIPVNYVQKAFVITGVAQAGKSLLLRVINEILLGKQNVSNIPWQNLGDRFKTAELYGKLANIFSDLPTKNIDDTGFFKSLVGEDFMTVEKKNKNPFSFQSYARLLFSCNVIPKNYADKSEGFYRRLCIIRFNRPVPNDEKDPNLIVKFQTEADGIFLFALDGLKRLIKNNYILSETEKNRLEVEKYREDSDSMLAYIKECCDFGTEYEVGSTDLYNSYKNFCDECNLKPYSHRTFITNLKLADASITSGKDSVCKRRVLKGLKIKDDLDF